MTLILGTSSEFRRSFFRQTFPDFIFTNPEFPQFISPNIDEKSIRDPDYEQLCRKIANAKCDAILRQKLPENAIILTFDQIVVCQNELREKPKDELEARTFLKSYSEGHEALALSGIVAHNVQTSKRCVLLDKVTVKFIKFPETIIEHLITKGEIFQASGAFTIDDRELGKYVQFLDSTIDAIEGLPVAKLKQAVQQVSEEFPFKIEKPLAQITHVLFDMDGLLLDTEVLYSKATQKILDPLGLKFTPDVKAKMMGKKSLEANQIMIEHFGHKAKGLDPQKCVEDLAVILNDLFPNCDLMPGVLRLLLHFKRHRVPMAVATSSNKRHFELKVTKHRQLFEQVFDHIITGDDVEKSKPDPEIFLKAAEKFENAPQDMGKVLVFEDAHLGVEAANAANMKVVWVYDQQEIVSNVKADQSIKSLFYFQPPMFNLPDF